MNPRFKPRIFGLVTEGRGNQFPAGYEYSLILSSLNQTIHSISSTAGNYNYNN